MISPTSCFPANRGDQLFQSNLLPLILRNEELPNAVRIKVTERWDFRMKKFMRLLQEHPGAVTCLFFCTARTPVIDIA